MNNSEDRSALRALLESAHLELCEAVKRQWDGKPGLKISIPVRPDADSDLIIGRALQAAIEMLDTHTPLVPSRPPVFLVTYTYCGKPHKAVVASEAEWETFVERYPDTCTNIKIEPIVWALGSISTSAAADARAQRDALEGWQPIATAPIEGRFLVCDGTRTVWRAKEQG